MIELLVVLAIVATLIGLVGPLTIDRVTKYQSKVEIVEVKNLISRYSNVAFLKGENITLLFKENSISEIKSSEIINRFFFNNLTFYPSEVSFNTSGIPNFTEIKLIASENEHVINVFEVVYEQK